RDAEPDAEHGGGAAPRMTKEIAQGQAADGAHALSLPAVGAGGGSGARVQRAACRRAVRRGARRAPPRTASVTQGGGGDLRPSRRFSWPTVVPSRPNHGGLAPSAGRNAMRILFVA